jgi:hypothetical protein
MIDFNTIQLEEIREEDIPKRPIHHLLNKRYVIGCDPYDKDATSEFSVFYVYDKVGMSTILKCVTKKRTFDQFTEWITNAKDIFTETMKKNQYFISKKFIAEDGQPIRITTTKNNTGDNSSGEFTELQSNLTGF